MIKPLGPEGVRQRMAQIEARLEQLNPRASGESFQAALEKAGAAPLKGQIGGGTVLPFNPASPNVTTEPSSSGLRTMVQQAAESQGLPEALLNAVVSAESGHNPNAESYKGAMGLMQLMPGTARSLGVTDPFDPMQNLMGGARYLRGLLDQFGDVPTALAAYNAGPTRIRNSGGRWPAETTNYVDKVMSLYQGGNVG
jgi:soluble lytic murein transglycosylase-like protein